MTSRVLSLTTTQFLVDLNVDDNLSAEIGVGSRSQDTFGTRMVAALLQQQG